jgi:hypothetical protein
MDKPPRAGWSTMKRLRAYEVAILLVLVALLVPLTIWIGKQATGAELKDKALALDGATMEQVRESLGDPMREMSPKAYEQSERKGIASVYEPDPPSIEADVIWLYSEGNRIVLLFFTADTVEHIYTGQT